MSIIYDALQKVQKNITKETASTLQPQTSKETHPVKPKSNHILIYIFVVCLGLAIGNFAYNFLAHKPKRVTSGAPALPLPKQAAVTQNLNSEETANSGAALPEPTLVLSGVFFEQGDGYALINNKIVRLGDEVEQAKVKEITIDGVTLDFGGKTIKLSSPSS